MSSSKRHNRARPTGTEFIASAAAIAAGTVAYGEVIRFDNPQCDTFFDWSPSCDEARYLDITRSALDQQPGVPAQAAFEQYKDCWPGGYCGYGSCPTQFSSVVKPTTRSAGIMPNGYPYAGSPVHAPWLLDKGYLIGVGSGQQFVDSIAAGFSGWSCCGGYCTCASGGLAGVTKEAYLGVSIVLKDGVHYGWIKVEPNAGPNLTTSSVEAVAWGWETEPDKAIAAGASSNNPPADLNHDGLVGEADLAMLLGSWGVSSEICVADITGDSKVDVADLVSVLSHWDE